MGEVATGLEWWRDAASITQSFGTVALGFVGGAWAYWKFGLRQDLYPHIEASADIRFIGEFGEQWIVELVADVENKGEAQHRIDRFDFNLWTINPDDELEYMQWEDEQITKGSRQLLPRFLRRAGPPDMTAQSALATGSAEQVVTEAEAGVESDTDELEFPNLVKKGSFLKAHKYLVVHGGVKATYKYVAHLPKDAVFARLSVEFGYHDRRNFEHSFECTVKVPRDPKSRP